MKFKTLLLLCTIPAAAFAALPFTFQSGGVISANEMNSNFSTLEARIAALESAKNAASSLKHLYGTTSSSTVNKILRNDTTNVIEIISFEQVTSGNQPVAWSYFIACDAGGNFSKSYIAPGCTLSTQGGASFYTVVYR
jgi:hypothetical protein